MLEAHSPLGADARFEREGVVLFESASFTLVQVAGEDKHLKRALGKMPSKVGVAAGNVMRVGPQQFWLLGQHIEANEGVFVTVLTSSRTRIHLEGKKARQILSAVALIDFDFAHFKKDHFVLTGIHHTPVVIHCIDDNSFHIYILRTFALNVWDWLCDVAEGLDHA